MCEAIGIRLDDHFIKKKAAQEYEEGKITLSKAANNAEITIWEMEKFLIEQGYKSDYSVDDSK